LRSFMLISDGGRSHRIPDCSHRTRGCCNALTTPIRVKPPGCLSAQRKSAPSIGNNGTLSETSLPVWRSEHSLSAQSRADELSDGATRRRCLYAKSLHQPEAGSLRNKLTAAARLLRSVEVASAQPPRATSASLASSSMTIAKARGRSCNAATEFSDEPAG
jgi:hypothetical protein